MRVADFFCGGGGFSEGFRQAGFEIVFAVDKWEPAVTTYRGNKPGVNVIQDDVIRISLLSDEEFEKAVPDSEVIIGSPPCQAFSHSNKSGNGDKTLGIQLIEAYLRIIARKKAKPNSALQYWVLENVPAVKDYIKEEYSAKDLGLQGSIVLHPHEGAAGIYNAKYFGAPTNRERYLCGEFPKPQQTHTDKTVVTLRQVLAALGDPASEENDLIYDVNYPGFCMNRKDVTDHRYIYELASFEWETAKRLKQDKGYMGKMSFPENLDKPARTVMATMTASAREAMILGYGEGKYRLPTVREAASMMSFPIDYQFYGKSKATKHTLVGNAVPPKLSYAVAKAILLNSGEKIPEKYIPIHHDSNIAFLNLNGTKFSLKQEQPRKDNAKFKYHIPYLILAAYRVELTNYHSDFEKKKYKWDAEIHHSQGKKKAKFFTPNLSKSMVSAMYTERVEQYISKKCADASSFQRFQNLFCMTTQQRIIVKKDGPYELLADIRQFIDTLLPDEEKMQLITINAELQQVPQAIAIGYYILKSIRNVLVSQEFLSVDREQKKTTFWVHPNFESMLAQFCKKSSTTLSLKQLQARLEADAIAGAKAESFVLKYERRRICNPVLQRQIKQISEIDVCAGYDIISYENDKSTFYDRFIEVKAIPQKPSFFWSRNELEIAKLHGEKYFLYLVDLSKIENAEYCPQIISNPVQSIMKSPDWIVEPESYHVQKI